MRSAALLALLPILATLPSAIARPHDYTHYPHKSHKGIRKSLSFGPTHSHATYEVLSHAAEVSVAEAFGGEVEIDYEEVARRFVEDKIGGGDGVSFYIRDDSYTDKHTGVTHVYARQILNGLEVSDGDINLNIDAHGRVISWGNSFHPAAAPAFSTQGSAAPSGETAKVCSELRAALKVHKAEMKLAEGDHGAWGLVKAAAEVLFPQLGVTRRPHNHDQVRSIRKNIKHVKNHIKAVCAEHDDDDAASNSAFGAEDGHMLAPVEALLTLLPRISNTHDLDDELSVLDFMSTPEHAFAPKNAPAEPPTEHISGPGLAKAGVTANVPARLMYTQTSAGQPRMVWKFEVQMKDNWYEAYVDTVTGELLRIVDWSQDFTPGGSVEMEKGGKQKPLPAPPTKYKPYTYQVFPWGVNDPSVGNLSIVTKPWDTTASPLGWHVIPTEANPWPAKLPGMNVTGNTTTFYTTAGNNVIAHEDWEGQNNFLTNYRPVNDSMVFVYDYGEYDGLAPREYVDMVVTQLFYTSNMFHDLLYRMGFDELSGNFQAYNFGLGGKGADPVICNAQDGSGTNNANFMTPPDGQAPRMRMYVWDTISPWRDGDTEAGIVIHEYSHGLSTRLTGGPANSGCLGFGEAGGMGEGWGDAIATLIRQIEEHKNFKNGTDTYAMGAWAANRATGIRNYKYSTNSTINPSSYKTLDKPGYWGVHAIGEVWAEFLFVMSQRLIEKYGFSETLFPPTNTSEPNDYYTKTFEESVDATTGKPKPLIPKHGNTLALQLIINGMKLQPCRPSFFDARNAIIQADDMLTGGENACLIWKAFAERGLGTDANVIGQTPWGGGIRTDGFKIPNKICKDEKH